MATWLRAAGRGIDIVGLSKNPSGLEMQALEKARIGLSQLTRIDPVP